MKKLKSFLFIFYFLFVSFHVTAYASDTTAKVFATDITAYIDGLAIPSYNIDGKIGIDIDDLTRYHHFDLSIFLDYPLYQLYYSKYDIPLSEYVAKQNTVPTGTFLTYAHTPNKLIQLNGNIIPAYDVNGKIIILMDSLNYCGKVTWYPEQRKTCFEYIASLNHYYSSRNKYNIYPFSIELERDDTGTFTILENNNCYLSDISFGKNKTIGIYFKFSIPSYETDIIKAFQKILNDMINVDYAGNIIEKGNDITNEHIQSYINGEKHTILFVRKNTQSGNNEYQFYLENTDNIDLDDIQSIRIEYQ